MGETQFGEEKTSKAILKDGMSKQAFKFKPTQRS